MTDASSSDARPASTRPVVLGCLGVAVVLFVWLRCRWVGHLLVWDEAMGLCTARSFTSGVRDAFAAWFWRHPPLHTLLTLLLAPFQPGFAERAELLSIGLAALNQVLLFVLNRRLFGLRVAAWSALMLALFPGSILFDVWIKQDQPAVTFGLLALIMVARERLALSGLCLGVALLAKETAIFYCVGAFLVWWFSSPRSRSWKGFLMLAGIAAATCAWWYLIVAPRAMPGGSDSLKFAMSATSLWRGGWSFYFTKLPLELGWAGIAFVVLGLLVSSWQLWRDRRLDVLPAVRRAWPVMVLAPALVLLSVVPNKVAWTVIVLFPAWATLGACGIAALVGLVECRAQSGWLKCAVSGLVFVVLALGCWSETREGYEPLLARLDANQARGARLSRELAMLVNGAVKDGDRMLVTSFYYWKGMPPGRPDAIFTYYLDKHVEALVRSHERDLPPVIEDIRQYRLDWALLSPEPERAAAVFGGLETQFRLHPRKATGGWLFDTRPVWQTNAVPKR